MNQELLEQIFNLGPDANLQLADPSLVRHYNQIEKRTYWITDEIGDSVYPLIYHILEWNREDQDLDIADRQPIKLIINSPGGSLEQARLLVDIMEISKTPIYGIALGCVASAASLIYLACDHRVALKSSYFIFHKGGASDLHGSYEELNSFMENYQRDIDELSQFYKAHTNFAPELIDEKLKGEWYIRINEALEREIVHELAEDIDIFL